MDKPFVLIVEDERDIAALFRHVMDLAGYRTEIAASGTAALERLSNSTPDVVLLDLTLPGVSGIEVLSRMRADERLGRIPVVVITAHWELAENLAVEPDLVMLKPVSAAQLTDLVQRLARDPKAGELEPFDESPWDSLTGLYNRPFFMRRLESSLKSLKENGQNLFAVLTLSPEKYSPMQRAQGSKEADDYLRRLAAAIKACVRPTDTIARFDADHFLILIEQAPGLHIPEMIAARIQSRLNGRSAVASGVEFTCNIGVLLCDGRYDDAANILHDAEVAYAQARETGPGVSLTFDYEKIRAI